MRKTIVNQDSQNISPGDEKWLDLKRLAQVEITSEDASYPIEKAFEINGWTGWRASEAGKQTIRIIFDELQRINVIHLLFKEEQQARTQEFVLRWSPGNGQPYREIVRQQYNFSPESSTEQLENYSVNLEGVKIVELTIIPDVGGGNAHASISRLWMA